MGSRFPPRLWHPGLSWFTMSGRIEQSKSLPCPYSQARAHWKLGQSVDLPKENEAMSQGQRKKIEIFSSGCSICNETVEMVKRLVGSNHDIEIHDMHQGPIAARAKQYGIKSVPGIVVDGKLADCCAGRGPDEEILR